MKKFMILMLMLGMGAFVFAQDEMKPMKYEGSTWYEMNYMDLKPGKTSAVKKLIKKYETASESAGTPMPHLYWCVTGKYDLLVVWKMDGGPSDLEWKWQQSGIDWWKAFVKQEGSEEAANKVQEEFDSYIAGSNSQIVRADP